MLACVHDVIREFACTGGGSSGEPKHVKLFAVKIDTGDLREIKTEDPVPFANGAVAYKDGVALLAQV